MLPTDDFESESLGEFVESLRTGKTRPYMKSLPVPKTQEGPVLKVYKNENLIIISVSFFHNLLWSRYLKSLLIPGKCCIVITYSIALRQNLYFFHSHPLFATLKINNLTII
jgi:hypothetical protein